MDILGYNFFFCRASSRLRLDEYILIKESDAVYSDGIFLWKYQYQSHSYKNITTFNGFLLPYSSVTSSILYEDEHTKYMLSDAPKNILFEYALYAFNQARSYENW